MADPVTLATVGIASTAAAGGVGVLGNLFQGQAQSKMYQYQAGVARVNATLAKQDADYARSAGEVEQVTEGMKTRAQVGATRAGIGAGNVDITSGSGANVLKSEIEIGQQNQAIIRANTAKKAYGFDVKAAADTAQGQVYDSAASTSTTAADISAASTVIGTAGQVASKWYQYGQTFPGSNRGVNPGVYQPAQDF